MTAKDESAFREICRKNGWRFTRQRFAVYAFVRANRTHPGVDDVLNAVRRRMPHVTRESVFRILCDLASAGLVVRLDNLPSARFDACTESHGHFICRKCGKVVDFDLPKGIDVKPPEKGAQLDFTELRVSGVCARCLGNQ